MLTITAGVNPSSAGSNSSAHTAGGRRARIVASQDRREFRREIFLATLLHSGGRRQILVPGEAASGARELQQGGMRLSGVEMRDVQPNQRRMLERKGGRGSGEETLVAARELHDLNRPQEMAAQRGLHVSLSIERAVGGGGSGRQPKSAGKTR